MTVNKSKPEKTNVIRPEPISEHDPATVRMIAKKTLLEVAGDPRATAAARVSASRTLLESLGDLKSERGAPEDRALHEMTEAELDDELARLKPRSQKSDPVLKDVGVSVGARPNGPKKTAARTRA